MDNGVLGRSIFGEGLGGFESIVDVDNVNWSCFIVGDLNEGFVDVVVDEFYIKDIRVGEGGFDIGFEFWGFGGSWNIGFSVGLEVDVMLVFVNFEVVMLVDSFVWWWS